MAVSFSCEVAERRSRSTRPPNEEKPLPSRLATRTPRNRLFRVAVAAALALAALVALGFVYAARPAPPAPVDPANAAPAAPAAPADTATPAANWDKVAACETGGDWNINTGNVYYGGLQFNASTWRDYGGQGLPHQASKATQIAIGEKVLAKQGWDAWPVCSRKAGLH
jgi:Transglycosylase-like domain